ncbi:hypothetical protein Barb7_02331 [Bacteroidales bacterium Barb7]|nr:hypothetical protein Barb7_02331 [Bacteroidales bacterium Barb7]
MTHNAQHKLSGRPFRTFLIVLPLTSHSALLHVGLKSPVPILMIHASVLT